MSSCIHSLTLKGLMTQFCALLEAQWPFHLSSNHTISKKKKKKSTKFNIAPESWVGKPLLYGITGLPTIRTFILQKNNLFVFLLVCFFKSWHSFIAVWFMTGILWWPVYTKVTQQRRLCKEQSPPRQVCYTFLIDGILPVIKLHTSKCFEWIQFTHDFISERDILTLGIL